MTRSDDGSRATRPRRPAQDGRRRTSVGCEALIAREPDYADLRNDAAAALTSSSDQPRARLDHFAVVRRLQPQSARGALQRRRGARGALAGRPTPRASMRAAMRLDPAYSLRAQQSRQPARGGGRVDEARAPLRARGRDSGPSNAEAQNNLGAVLLGVRRVRRVDAAPAGSRCASGRCIPKRIQPRARAGGGRAVRRSAIGEATIAGGGRRPPRARPRLWRRSRNSCGCIEKRLKLQIADLQIADVDCGFRLTGIGIKAALSIDYANERIRDRLMPSGVEVIVEHVVHGRRQAL